MIPLQFLCGSEQILRQRRISHWLGIPLSNFSQDIQFFFGADSLITVFYLTFLNKLDTIKSRNNIIKTTGTHIETL